jgi:hypothetical protein
MKLADVPIGEAAEVMAINYLAPMLLNSQLKDLMMRSNTGDKKVPRFIINVSAMEGKFYRYKSANHPHTNAAKAALNMMTRTSAQDYVNASIFMTAVDTGWSAQQTTPASFCVLCARDSSCAPAVCLQESTSLCNSFCLSCVRLFVFLSFRWLGSTTRIPFLPPRRSPPSTISKRPSTKSMPPCASSTRCSPLSRNFKQTRPSPSRNSRFRMESSSRTTSSANGERAFVSPALPLAGAR